MLFPHKLDGFLKLPPVGELLSFQRVKLSRIPFLCLLDLSGKFTGELANAKLELSAIPLPSTPIGVAVQASLTPIFARCYRKQVSNKLRFRLRWAEQIGLPCGAILVV